MSWKHASQGHSNEKHRFRRIKVSMSDVGYLEYNTYIIAFRKSTTEISSENPDENKMIVILISRIIL